MRMPTIRATFNIPNEQAADYVMDQLLQYRMFHLFGVYGSKVDDDRYFLTKMDARRYAQSVADKTRKTQKVVKAVVRRDIDFDELLCHILNNSKDSFWVWQSYDVATVKPQAKKKSKKSKRK